MIREQFIERWRQCQQGRYRVLVIVPEDETLFGEALVAELAGMLQARVVNYRKQYEGRLETFLTWGTLREKIYRASKGQLIIVTELEPFYAKWPVEERLHFLRNLLRTETKSGIILILHCQEDLSEIAAIDRNKRGIIWAPKR